MFTFMHRISRHQNRSWYAGIVNNPMIVFPNAKINIGLRILRRRRDGYHDLESIFYPAGLCDMLEILPYDTELNSRKPEIYVSGLKAPASAENLCWKAAKLFRERHKTPGVRIHLHKKIPVASGLGGGSSDASFALLALNEMFGCGLKEDTLGKYASELGSDCSFFIGNRPSLVSGRGNILEPVSLSLAGYYLVLVFPDVAVPTDLAYRMVIPSEEGPSLRTILGFEPGQWKDRAGNQFEETVFEKFPELSGIKKELYRSGADFASMTGSGSALYGIFHSSPRFSPGLKKYKTYTEKMV